MNLIIILTLIFLPLFSMAQPEINVLGNGQTILDGDITPDTSDHTYFDTAYCIAPNNIITTSRSYVIQNTGTSDLIISNIQTSYYVLYVTGITFPDTIAPGTSDTFSINMSIGIQENYHSSINIINNDADEGNYNFDITAIVNSNVSVTISYAPYLFFGTTTTAIGSGGVAPYYYLWAGGEIGSSLTISNTGCPSSDTIPYYLWVVDSFGCGISMEVLIPCIVQVYCWAYSTGANTTGCLPVPPSFPMSYNVVNGGQNGTFLMTNDSCFQYTPSPTFSGSDTVTVEVCDSSSGICTFYYIIFNSDTSALTTNMVAKPISDISIYPNPNTQGLLTINWATSIQPKNIFIIDALGREVRQYIVDNNVASQQIDIQTLPSGYYTVLLETNKEVIGREKLIVIKP